MWATRVTFVHEALKAGKTDPAGGPAGLHEGPGPGHLPHDHLLPHPGRLRLPWARARAPHRHRGRDRASPRPTPPAVGAGPSPSSASSSATRRRSCAAAAATRASSAPPPAVPAGWAGSTLWPPSYGCMVQGATQVALTCLDVLGYLDEIPVCTGYEIDGTGHRRLPRHPAADAGQAGVHDPARLEVRHPGLHRLQRPAPAGQGLCGLPGGQRIGYPITMVSTGPKRHEITVRQK